MSRTSRQLAILIALLALGRPDLPQDSPPPRFSTVSTKDRQSPAAARKYLNVREFGATGVGTTDDTTAIQRAINAASPGDAVMFPNGTYLVAGLTVAKPVALRGRGGATLKANGVALGTAILSINKAGGETLVTGLRFAGNDLTRAIDVDSADRIVVSSSRFDSRFRGQTVRLRSSHSSRIHDNFFEWEGKQGPDGGPDANAIVSLWESDRVEVLNNLIVGLREITDPTRTQRGIFSQLGNGVSIIGNVLTHRTTALPQTGTPIAMWASIDTPKHGGIIANNHIDGGSGNQVYVKNRMYRVVISANVITNAHGAGGSAALVCADQADHCVITSNTVYGSSSDGDGINIRAQNSAAPKYCIVHGNTIQGTARNGISLEGAAHVVSNNIVRGSGSKQVIVQARAEAVEVYDNYLDRDGGAISDFGSNTSFRNNGATGAQLVKIDQNLVFVHQSSSSAASQLINPAMINLRPTWTTDTTRQVLASYSLPANSLSARLTGFRITALATTAANENHKSFGLDFGATTCATQRASASGSTMRLEVTVFKTGRNTQECSGLSTTSTGVRTHTHAAPTEPEAGPTTIAVWGRTPKAPRDLTFRSLWVEFIN